MILLTMPNPRPTKIPLVLVPGLLCDALLWAPQIGALSDIADCWVYRPTDSDTIKDLAEQLLAQAPFKEFALAGLSMGGYVALEVMRQAANRVQKLALLNTNALADTATQIESRAALQQLSRSGQFPQVIESLLPALVNRARSYNHEVVGTIRTMARNVGEQAFYRQESAIIGRIDSRAHLGAIRCKTLLLCGRQDALTPIALHEEMANEIIGSNLAVIDDCGHLSTLEQPEEVSVALRTWLLG
ncbi:MAG: alpha/beta fold hydrolase [Burkholderiales bacterium]